MGLINFSLKNRYAVLAACDRSVPAGRGGDPRDHDRHSAGLQEAGRGQLLFLSRSADDGHGKVRHLARRTGARRWPGKIEHQESRTVPGAAVIKIFFQPGADPSSAMNDIVNLEASDMFHLPPGIEWPFTLRSEPANLPVVLAAISGEGLSESELYTIGYYAVRNKMGGLKGVQIPHPFGGKFRQMMVYVDPAKLQALSCQCDRCGRRDAEIESGLGAGTARMGGTDYQVHPRNTLPDDRRDRSDSRSRFATTDRSSFAMSAASWTMRRCNTTSSASTESAASTVRCCASRVKTRSPWSIASTKGSPARFPR